MRELLSKRLAVFVGRHKERSLISETIVGTGRPVLFLIGDAGIGKTRLLEEVERIVEEHDPVETDILCLPILNFYDTAMHSGSAIEEAIVSNLAEREVNHAFEEFREKLVECREGRISEEQLWEAFKRGYGEVCQDRRIVLRLDTAEILEYEHDDPEVLEDCEVVGLEAPALGWLAEKAPQLQNTAIIVASRPNEDLRKRLEDAYGKNLGVVELEELTLEETQEYFCQAGDFGQQVLASSPEMVEKIWLLSGGQPIFISLSLDWLQRGVWDERVYPVDVATLREMRDQGSEQWEEMKRGFGISLVQKIREFDTLLDKVACYAARARKGCSTELLVRIMETSDEEIKELMPQFSRLSFVKRPHVMPTWREEWFFLHDEMYDLIEEHVWQASWPVYQEQERVAKKIIGYYDDEIHQVEERIRRSGTERERSDLQHRRHILLTERLYYQFDLDPWQGLAEYDRLDTQACSERAMEWDNLLRIETMRFMRQRPKRAEFGNLVTIRGGKVKIADRVNMDCRARWVHRYVAHNKNRKAIEIATKLLKKYPEVDLLWKVRLLVSRAAAEERLGHLGENWLFDEARNDIRKALKLLSKVELDEFDEWMLDYWKATAYIYQGLVARALLELREASRAYEKAASLCKKIGYQPGEARALNNRAFVLARQRELGKALDDCQGALEMRQKAGDEHGIALSFNTLGIIKGMTGDFIGALTESKKALGIFQRRRDEIGIALACINLGWAYRRYASSDMRRNPADIQRLFKLAENLLLQARKSEDRLEPYYRVEVHNELGCTYKDWGNFLALHGAEEALYHELMERAGEEFGVANEIAGAALKLKKADNLEDWAWVFHLRYAYRDVMGEEDPQLLLQKAHDKLDEAEQNLRDFKERAEPGLEANLYMGKIHFQRAHLMKFYENWKEAAKNYALAAAYLEAYSAEAEELRELLLGVENWLGQFSKDKIQDLVGVMNQTVSEREAAGWKCETLRSWIGYVILGAPELRLEG